MKRLKANTEKTLQAVTNYVDYLETQRYRNETAQKKDHVNQEESIENFIVSDLKIYLGNDTWAQRFRPTLNALNKSEFYTPIILNNLLEYSSAQQIYTDIKRMVQTRIMRKHNVDLHYDNAIFSFLKKRAKKYAGSTTFVTADANCKVPVGEPGFPIVAVARGKKVIVGENEVITVGDHDFSKLSLIPDAILIHTIPADEKSFEIECNNQSYFSEKKPLGRPERMKMMQIWKYQDHFDQMHVVQMIKTKHLRKEMMTELKTA